MASSEPLYSFEDLAPEVASLRLPVLRVFDGDGFLTRITRPGRADVEVAVRFGFIDAPEMEQRGGREARDFLKSLIDGRWLDLVILTKMDTGKVLDGHGRLVCVPYLREETPQPKSTGASFLTRLHAGLEGSKTVARNIELEMVLNGWAWVLERYEPDQSYLDALADARRHRRGIWEYRDNVHPWEFKRQKYRPRRADQTHPDMFSAQRPRELCPHTGCGGRLLIRNGRFGQFLGCSNYPTCSYSCAARG